MRVGERNYFLDCIIDLKKKEDKALEGLGSGKGRK